MLSQNNNSMYGAAAATGGGSARRRGRQQRPLGGGLVGHHSVDASPTTAAPVPALPSSQPAAAPNSASSSPSARSSNPAAEWLKVYHDHDGTFGRFTDAPDEHDEADQQSRTVHPAVLALLVRKTLDDRDRESRRRPEEHVSAAADGGGGGEELPWWQQDQEDDDDELSFDDDDDDEGGGKFGDADEDGTARDWVEYAGAEALTHLSAFSGLAAGSDRMVASPPGGATPRSDNAPRPSVDAIDGDADTADPFDFDLDLDGSGGGGSGGGEGSLTDSDAFSLGGYRRRAAARLRAEEEEEQHQRRRKKRDGAENMNAAAPKPVAAVAASATPTRKAGGLPAPRWGRNCSDVPNVSTTTKTTTAGAVYDSSLKDSRSRLPSAPSSKGFAAAVASPSTEEDPLRLARGALLEDDDEAIEDETLSEDEDDKSSPLLLLHRQQPPVRRKKFAPPPDEQQHGSGVSNSSVNMRAVPRDFNVVTGAIIACPAAFGGAPAQQAVRVDERPSSENVFMSQ